jgi:hypothetical protein
MAEAWKPIPMSGETVPDVKLSITFVKSAEPFVLGDFLETINHAVVISIAWSLSLKSDFHDFEWLHNQHLEPS